MFNFQYDDDYRNLAVVMGRDAFSHKRGKARIILNKQRSEKHPVHVLEQVPDLYDFLDGPYVIDVNDTDIHGCSLFDIAMISCLDEIANFLIMDKGFHFKEKINPSLAVAMDDPYIAKFLITSRSIIIYIMNFNNNEFK